jgi:hypothetical protein
MRQLTQPEIDRETEFKVELAECRQYQPELQAVETTVDELAALSVGTECGTTGNKCFSYLAKKGFGTRVCRCIYDAEGKTVKGAFVMQVVNDAEAEQIAKIVYEGEGSLEYGCLLEAPERPSGFCLGLFEIE